MRVIVYPSDRTGCGYYRIRWPVEALRAQGHEIIVRPDDDLELESDVIVFQRPMSEQLARLIPELRAEGTAVVVELDDDVLALDSRIPAWTQHHPRANPKLTGRWLAESCRQATLVTCSTPALAERYGSPGRTVVLPNYVPERFVTLGRQPGAAPVLGWAGSVITHPDDLRTTGNALARLRYPFHVLGPADGVVGALGIDTGQVTATGWVAFDQWPHAVATLDVGIAPLASTAFNRAKSWLKPLEYSALGVAWVASDLPEYRRLARLGAGTIARKPNAWLRELRQLLDDDSYRAEQADAGRAVAATLTIERHAWRWWEAWAEALMLERARTRPAAPGRARP
jgi:glycosyltransferase involved in cell wall biosynthesis